MKSTFAFGAAAALFLLAAPLSIAQVTTPEPTAPPAATPATPETPAAPETQPAPATPAAPAAPTTNPAVPATPAAPAVEAQSEATGNAACRTRKDVGEQCSCLSAPTDFGTSTAHEAGTHNVCVVPAS